MPEQTPLSVAVTSWLTPGTAAYNTAFLAAKPSLEADGCRIVEMGICCYCLEDSLTFSPSDWPRKDRLPAGFSFHLHLPVDLPWRDDSLPPGRLAGQKSAGLMRMLAQLKVSRAVLHPPDGQNAVRLFDGFLEEWQEAGFAPENLMIENLRESDPALWAHALEKTRASVCLDVAHMMAYDQYDWAMRLPAERVRLTHWSAPGDIPGSDSHGPLSSLTPAQLSAAKKAAARFYSARPMLEVFSWKDALLSMPVLKALYQSQK